MRRIISLFLSAAVLALFLAGISTPALAQNSNASRFRYSLWSSEMSTKLEVSSGTTFGTEFSLNDLGMDKKETIEVWELEMWQGSMRLDISFWENRWDGYAQINRNIVFEGINYNISDIVDSSFRMRTTDVSLTTTISRSYQAHLGFVSGMKYIEYYSKIWNVTGGVEAKESAVAPIPYFGASLELLVGEQTILGGRFVLFQYAYSGTNVDVTNFYQADGYVEFKAGQSLALRIGFHNMVINYENKTAGDGFKVKQLIKGTYAAIYLSF